MNQGYSAQSSSSYKQAVGPKRHHSLQNDTHRACLQYAFIYFSLLTGNSYLMSYYLNEYIDLFAVLLMAAVVLIPKFWRFRDMAFLAFLLVLSAVVRCLVGGAGIGTFTTYTTTILSIVLAIKIDRTLFLKRLIRLVCVLTIISTLMYFARIAIPGLYYQLPLYEFESQGTYYSMSTASNVNYHTKGLLLFSMREGETRNIGLYTEPGLYQGVLTGSLFCILFLSKWLNASKRERTVESVILILGIATCGSTTGLIGTGIVILIYIFSSQVVNGIEDINKIKSRFILIIIIAIAALIADWAMRGDSSILVESVLSKLLTSSGAISVNQGNGEVRIDTVVASFELLFQHPFGVGFDTVQEAKGASAVGAGLFTTSAALGVPFAVAYLYWLLSPVFRAPVGAAGVEAYLVLYFLFAVSQSLVLTPVLVAVSVYLSIYHDEEMRHSHAGALALQHAN